MTGHYPPDQHAASLDDLLGVAATEPPGQPAAPGLRRIWRDLLFSVVIAAGTWVTLRALGVAIPYALLFGVLMVAALVRQALATVTAPPVPPALTGRRPDALPAGDDSADGLFLATSRWNTRLSWTDRDHTRFALAIQPRLVEVADERLRLRHGVTRAADPQRARQLLGEQLWSLVHQRVARNPTHGELAAIIAQMEAL